MYFIIRPIACFREIQHILPLMPLTMISCISLFVINLRRTPIILNMASQASPLDLKNNGRHLGDTALKILFKMFQRRLLR